MSNPISGPMGEGPKLDAQAVMGRCGLALRVPDEEVAQERLRGRAAEAAEHSSVTRTRLSAALASGQTLRHRFTSTRKRLLSAMAE